MNPFNSKICGFACPEEHKCWVHGHNIPESAQLYICENCGNKTLEVIIDSGHIHCPNCHVTLSTCAGCIHGQHCQFEENPSPIPKVIMKTVRQGNAIMQTQVKNPERIAICCEGCHCYQENECMRQFQICSTYQFIYNNEENCNDKIFEAGQ